MSELHVETGSADFVFAVRGTIDSGDGYFLCYPAGSPEIAEKLFVDFLGEVTGAKPEFDGVIQITDLISFGPVTDANCAAARRETKRWAADGYQDVAEVADRCVDMAFGAECQEMANVLLAHGKQLPEASTGKLIVGALLMSGALLDDSAKRLDGDDKEDCESFRDAIKEIIDCFDLNLCQQL